MGTCYLHIGPHKTGSTTLQACLHANAAVLARSGLHVVSTDMVGTKYFHHRFAREIGHGGPSPCRDRIADELRSANLPERVVISSENFSAWIRMPEVRKRIASFFYELGYRVKIIAYIRPQIAAVNSYYTHHIKTFRLEQRFDAFFETFLANPEYDHLLRFQPVAEDLDIDTIFVPFVSSMLKAGICQDFLSRLEVTQAQIQGLVIPNPQNISPGPKTIEAFLTVSEALSRQGLRLPDNVLVFRSSGLRRITVSMGWDRLRFNGLSQEQKILLKARFGAANEEFARNVWKQSWSEMFGPDEERALGEERRCFDLVGASVKEKREFLSFCKFAMGVMSQPVHYEGRVLSPARFSSPLAGDAVVLRRRRARRRQP